MELWVAWVPRLRLASEVGGSLVGSKAHSHGIRVALNAWPPSWCPQKGRTFRVEDTRNLV